MSVIWEWRSAILNAVQNFKTDTGDGHIVAGFQGLAATSLRLASVAISTDSDRNAYQLLSNEFAPMQKFSNKIFLRART